jgi:arylsulfatase
VALLALGGHVGCARDELPPNVIFVLVDAVRADFLSIYDESRPTSPHLAAFAEESIVFENHVSQASCTYPSMNSLFTSRSPSSFLNQPEGSFAIPDELPTLAGVLQESDYATFAVSASPIVRNEPSTENPWGGFGAGFDAFDEDCLWQDAECVNEIALRHLETASRPFFLYLHYMDPHAPYYPPLSFERRFAREYTGRKRFIQAGNPGPIQRMLRGELPDLRLTEEDIEHLRRLYADEIAYFDSRFQEIVEALRRLELLDRSIVIVASDHGEAFMEHDLIEHCNASFDALTRTPLVLRLPDGEHAGRRISMTQNLDLFPTILDLLGIDSGDLELRGTSLRPVIERDESVQEFAFSLGGRDQAIRTRRFKLIYDFESESHRLYDLVEDPGETTDVSGDHPEEASRLERALEERMDVRGRDGLSIEERLRALGYLQ